MELWPFENAVVIAVLGTTIYLADLTVSTQTLGWALGAFALHTIRSHMGRMREDSGRPEDWTNTVGGWLGGTAAVLAATAPQRILLIVPLVLWVVHTIYRNAYRTVKPVNSGWDRDDD